MNLDGWVMVCANVTIVQELARVDVGLISRQLLCQEHLLRIWVSQSRKGRRYLGFVGQRRL